MTDKVVHLPGSPYRPAEEDRIDPDTVLEGAREVNRFLDVVIVGRLVNGQIAVLSSAPGADEVMGLMLRGIGFLQNATQGPPSR